MRLYKKTFLITIISIVLSSNCFSSNDRIKVEYPENNKTINNSVCVCDPATYSIVDQVGISVIGNEITRTASGLGWGDSGGASDIRLYEGDYISFRADLRVMMGLSEVNSNAQYNTQDYTFYNQIDGLLYVWEKGNTKTPGGTLPWDSNTLLKMSIEDGKVKYYANDIKLSYESTIANPSAGLIVDFSIYPNGSKIYDLQIFKDCGIPSCDPTSYSVTDHIGISVIGNEITRTASGLGWGDSGGASDIRLYEGDYISFRADLRVMMGLSEVNSNAHYNTQDYTFYNQIDGLLYVWEKSNTKTPGGTLPWDSNTLLKMSFEDGKVKYYANDIKLSYESTIANPSAGLIVDFSIYPNGSKIYDLQIFKDCGGATPSCSDGIQNQGEAGIDCGGPCADCPSGGSGLWTANGASIYYNSGNVGIGIINPPAKLTVNGAILGTQIKVKTDVSMFPDFVFDPDYPLMTITEVDNYIQTHGHLPDIPTAQETVSDGHDIGAMNLKLLQKIEELTLYIIELSNEINNLKNP